MVIEGKHDADIVENVQGKIVPSLRKNHGPDSIEEISTIACSARFAFSIIMCQW